MWTATEFKLDEDHGNGERLESTCVAHEARNSTRHTVVIDENGGPPRLFRALHQSEEPHADTTVCFNPAEITDERDRKSLKVNLASSTIQLGRTPWLGRFWTNEDVYFASRVNGDDVKIMFTKPYVTNPERRDSGRRG